MIADVLEAFEDTGADAIYADLDYVDEADGRTVTRRWKSGLMIYPHRPQLPILSLRRWKRTS